MLSGASRITLRKVFPVQCCPRRYSSDNIAQTKTQCSVAREFPNNTGENPVQCCFNTAELMQCCPRGSRQQCTGKKFCSLLSLYSWALGTTLHKSKPMQCCPRGSRQYCTGKNLVQCCRNTPGTTLHKKSSMQSFARCSRQHCTGEKPGNVF